jgi:hypothetical protein
MKRQEAKALGQDSDEQEGGIAAQLGFVGFTQLPAIKAFIYGLGPPCPALRRPVLSSTECFTLPAAYSLAHVGHAKEHV